ncbi:MAG: spore coat associated protein CotJA [Cellulosilyticum sp.]|nr:spore coat associated protein CotJA [Cellulosilyticum sp.]
MNNRNCSRRPMNLRDMNDYNMKMELNEFVGMNQPCDTDIENMPIAMAYVPWQQWRMIYEPKEALKRGTIFKELDLPFEAAKECK